MEDMTKAYNDFFKESVAGQAYRKKLEDAINLEHKEAENNPELARDHTQRAKGIRKAIEIINNLTVRAKTGKNTE